MKRQQRAGRQSGVSNTPDVCWPITPPPIEWLQITAEHNNRDLNALRLPLHTTRSEPWGGNVVS